LSILCIKASRLSETDKESKDGDSNAREEYTLGFEASQYYQTRVRFHGQHISVLLA